MRNGTRWILWFLVMAGIVPALWIGFRRAAAENDNRRVEIVLDWDEVRALAAESGASVTDVMDQFYLAGARGMAINEESIGQLLTLRRIEIEPSEPRDGEPSDTTVRLRVPDPLLRARIVNALRFRWDVALSAESPLLDIPAGWREISGLSLGFPADVVSFVRARHFEPVLRISNFSGADSLTISWVADRLEAQGARLVVFGGDQVLGFPDGIPEAARAFATRDLLFGQIEFGKQKGEERLARALRGDVVRVHSINPVEMARMADHEVVSRFLLAVEERNIRALYVRLLPGAQQPRVAAQVRYVNSIARSLGERGFELSLARPYTPYESPVWARSLVGLGVGASTLLLASYVWPVAGRALALLIVLALADALLPVLGIGRRLVALQGALVAPVLAFAWLRVAMERRWGRGKDAAPDEAPLARALLRKGTLVLFLRVTLISLLGAVWVVGLLSSRDASVKITAFSGVKAQQALALIAIAAIYYLDIDARGGLAKARARVTRRVNDLWNQPLMAGMLVVSLAVVIALAMLLARSGNDPGVGISPLELRFRSALDALLGVRPRTKEFLIGHPALLLGIALVSLRRVKWALPLLLVGAIGQVSIVNTFSHLHTPLVVSLLRTAHGLWIGAAVALAAALALGLLRPRRRARA